MKPIFHPDAEREFLAAIRQYAEIDLALAVDFEAKVEAADVFHLGGHASACQAELLESTNQGLACQAAACDKSEKVNHGLHGFFEAKENKPMKNLMTKLKTLAVAGRAMGLAK